MVKIEIDVDQVLTAVVALEIEPGDKIFVMNGLIVGLVEKRRSRAETITELRATHSAELPSFYTSR